MAVYKVIQDIEAEDKLLGPLTLKQFIFAVIALGFTFAAFMIVSKTGQIYLAIPFLPFILVPGILAAPLGRDQPTDVWLAAQVRFLIKPRKRIWDQTGIKNLVTITAPKKLERIYTDGLSQQEVRSRLKALADTIDSRGWAVKDVDVNLFATPAYALAGSDRLIDPSSLPQTVPDTDISAADDIMDAVNNPVAQHFDAMVHQAATDQKNAAIQHMQAAMHQAANPQTPSKTAPVDPWFMHQPDPSQTAPGSAMFTPITVTPGASPTADDNTFLASQSADNTQINPDEQALLEHIRAEKQNEHQAWAHHKTIKTADEIAAEEAERKKAEAVEAAKKAQAVTPPKNPGIVELANTNDLSVASVAHLANRKVHNNNNEVIVKLH